MSWMGIFNNRFEGIIWILIYGGMIVTAGGLYMLFNDLAPDVMPFVLSAGVLALVIGVAMIVKRSRMNLPEDGIK
ncbi:hypothetical protein [Piscinibacterium candidicorallinum]|uniref:Uncharacterized protein n=1 Tax=Piscinibacterium candidicorallinum TaxID=1793872 RepID=A0ABV7GZP4_9BURK